MRRIPALLLRSFLQGLLLLSPIALTGYLLYSVFINVDSLVPVAKMPPGIGFLIIIGAVTIIGVLGTRFFIGKWIFDSFANLLEHTPGVKFIYSSIRDVIKSFVGDKKRFNKPVWVRVNNSPEIWRIGFMTQTDMSHLGLINKVAVYMPHAYAISGWVIVTDGTNVKPVQDMTAGEAMKFAVSGGITTEVEAEGNGKKAQL
ncbi:MAG: hypothetical protein JWQ38_1649 [Flavipsychrobacter sp.]|nr:hypothetical protein [Flavipsychrobacter sp.]